jgi:hypothetical protein
MKIKRLPTSFVFPARPVLASNPPPAPNWAREIKHDGHRIIREITPGWSQPDGRIRWRFRPKRCRAP